MDKIYKLDSKGKIRVWWMEVDGNAYNTFSGILDGKIVESGLKYAEAKNVGRANATTAEEQARLEVEYQYKKQLDQGGYWKTIEEAKADAERFFEPMLAKKYEDVKFSFPVMSQPKLDGVRCVARRDGLFSRNGKPLIATPHIERALAPLFERYPTLVIDGELYNHDLRHDFEEIISIVRKSKPDEEDLLKSERLAEYHVYDLYNSEGNFTTRFMDLNAHVSSLGSPSPVKLVQTVLCYDQDQLDERYGSYLEQGYEGQMIRLPLSSYEQKRSKNLLKRKEFEDAEFKIVEVVEGVGNWAGYAKAVTIELPDGSTQSSGLRGSQDRNRQLLVDRDKYVGGTATVRYQNKTVDGKLRFPVVVALYEGERDI